MAATYDLNGNINTMWRKGSTAENSQMVATAFGVIDDMTYSYANNSNTLTKVSDNGLSTDGFKDGTNTGNDYTYDDNGNLISDKNKDITSITYNHLNLPNIITFVNGNTITWLYDAAGVKLQKQTYEYANNTTNTKDYIGGIEYNNNTIEAIYTDEGRAMPNGSTYRYEYTIKDHLGNSRVMFSDIDNDGQVDENEIIQEEHYYPFGIRMEGYGRTITHGENDYQYNGKELNTDFGLDMYDYGARFYDASVGRWFVVDKLSEHPNQIDKSIYAYVWDNPINLDDPDGNCPQCFAGALLGGAFEVGLQITGNLATGKKWNDLDWFDIGAATAGGFVSGGLSNISKIRKVTKTFKKIDGVLAGAGGQAAEAVVDVGTDDNAMNIEVAGVQFLYEEGSYHEMGDMEIVVSGKPIYNTILDFTFDNLGEIAVGTRKLYRSNRELKKLEKRLKYLGSKIKKTQDKDKLKELTDEFTELFDKIPEASKSIENEAALLNGVLEPIKDIGNNELSEKIEEDIN